MTDDASIVYIHNVDTHIRMHAGMRDFCACARAIYRCMCVIFSLYVLHAYTHDI